MLRPVERTVSAAALHLIVPEVELDGWTTTLPPRLGAQQIIDRHADHGAHRQTQAEFRTNRDFTRLPSGKFATHALVCKLAAATMNLLRLMGQQGLLGPDAPVRQRIETVMPESACRVGLCRPWRSWAHSTQVMACLAEPT
ncbi:MAG: hypothetical protein C0505_03625 [Leptothrix sp. (in: Bacteria)]|nr:hypothetical protein [Leptothrix sp. (in: b-proteobacteria)]